VISSSGKAVLEAGLGKTILVVDDDPIMLKNYETILKEAGHLVITRQDGRSALADILAVLRPDLIIADYRMPGMDGLEFIAQLKTIWPMIPLILCSLHVRADLYAKKFSPGIAAYLSKPFSSQELLLAVDMALRTTAGRANEVV